MKSVLSGTDTNSKSIKIGDIEVSMLRKVAKKISEQIVEKDLENEAPIDPRTLPIRDVVKAKVSEMRMNPAEMVEKYGNKN